MTDEERKKKAEELTNTLIRKLDDLIEDHGVGILIALAALHPKHFCAEPFNWAEAEKHPFWLHQVVVAWHSEFRHLVSDDPSNLFPEDVSSLSKEDQIKLFEICASLCEISAMQINLLLNVGTQADKTREQLKKVLGMSRCRVIPLKPNTTYKIFTEQAMYEVEYDLDHKFNVTRFVSKLDGKDPGGWEVDAEYPELAFVGNIQESGQILGIVNFPVAATTMRMLFSKYPFSFEEGLQEPTIITDRITEVIDTSAVN